MYEYICIIKKFSEDTYGNFQVSVTDTKINSEFWKIPPPPKDHKRDVKAGELALWANTVL